MAELINLRNVRKRAKQQQEESARRSQPSRPWPAQAPAQARGRATSESQPRSRPAPDRQRRRLMKSPVVKRSIVIAGHKTSVSLEDAFWKCLKEIAGDRENDTVRSGGFDRHRPPRRQSVVGNPPVRARSLSRAIGDRGSRRARQAACVRPQFCGRTRRFWPNASPRSRRRPDIERRRQRGRHVALRWRSRRLAQRILVFALLLRRFDFALMLSGFNFAQLLRLIIDRPQRQPSGQRRHVDAAHRRRQRPLQAP